MATRSQAKLMMIKFLRETRDTVNEDGETVSHPDFSFRIKGPTEDAKRFVHRMRVELSRMRDTVKDSGKVPKEFKVLLDDMTFDVMDGITTITLKKAEGQVVRIAEEVEQIFDDLAGGAKLQ